jgi:hypothetical protein
MRAPGTGAAPHQVQLAGHAAAAAHPASLGPLPQPRQGQPGTSPDPQLRLTHTRAAAGPKGPKPGNPYPGEASAA